jgi:ATP-dependent protease ClpP protease subunit
MHWLIVNGELVLYGYVGQSDWDMPGFLARDVLDALLLIDGDVTVRLNSGGGLAMEGLAIYNTLRLHAQRNGVKILVIVDSAAVSAASLIAMAGDEVTMLPGSLMMIHDPSTVVIGTADEQRQSADITDKMADQFAAVYAQKAGITPDEARAIMKAETWYTPEEAVAAGFADAVGEGDAKAVALFDYRLYANSPSPLTLLATASATMFQPKAAPAAQPQETSMKLEELIAMLAARFKSPADDVQMFLNQAIGAGIPLAELTPLVKDAATMAAAKSAVQAKAAALLGVTPAPVVTPPVVSTMSVADVLDLTGRAAAAGLDIAATNAIMAAHSTKDAALAAIIDKVAEMRGSTAPTATAQVTVDAREKFREGASLALMAKVGIAEGQRNEFSGLSLPELARESLTMAGNTAARRLDKMSMVGSAFTYAATMSGGMMTTSDFAYILQNVASKSALKGYQEADETFQLWTSKGSASDFKPISRVDLGLFPNLLKVEEGSEFKYGTIGDRGASVVIATYGRLINISRQAIINDDLSILGTMPLKMGRAAKRTVGNLAYGVLTANANMPDGVPLFDAAHKNLGTAGAPSAAAWEEAVNLMGKQVDNEAIATALNIRPKYFLSGAYEFLAKQLLTSTASLADHKNAGVANTVQGLVTPITDRRITGNQWFFAADPNQYDTVEITYLDGIEEPVVETKDGWTIDGTELKVRLDAGANLLDYRGLVRNAGA